MTDLLSITIGIDPNITHIFGLLITWHGVFTAVGIIFGVWLAIGIADTERVGIDPDTAYTVGMIVVVAGIIGARGLYVAERYGDPNINSIADIFRLNEGGISIYGAIIGGALAGWAYGWWKRLPCAAGADAGGMAMLLGLAIGRIGDLINGEHFAKASSLPWAVIYNNPHNQTGAFERSFTVGATHPATTYEMIGDLVILGLLAVVWRWRPKSGVIFALAFLLYATMRFFVSFLRVDSKYPLFGLTTPQLVSLLVIAVMAPLLIYFLRREEPEHSSTRTIAERRAAAASRAERRRRLRTGSGT